MKRTILVIDDEPDFCFFLKENLELAGPYTVLTAMSGAEGLALALTARPDLIILDLLMPAIDGAAVYRQLDSHRVTAATPVIMLTALDPEIARERVPELPREAFLTKPVAITDLRARIEAILGATR